MPKPLLATSKPLGNQLTGLFLEPVMFPSFDFVLERISHQSQFGLYNKFQSRLSDGNAFRW